MTEECTTRTTGTESLPPVKCASWCTSGDGHTGAHSPGDQWCSSISFPVTLTREEPVLWGDGSLRPAQVSVYTSMDEGEPPFVSLVNNQNDLGTGLTPLEARELAAALTHAAWVAEQDDRERNALVIGRALGR